MYPSQDATPRSLALHQLFYCKCLVNSFQDEIGVCTYSININYELSHKSVLVSHPVTPIFGLAIVVIVFGYILSVFRMKYSGYPYRYVYMHEVTITIIFLFCFMFVFCATIFTFCTAFSFDDVFVDLEHLSQLCSKI